MSPPSSGMKYKSNEKPEEIANCFHSGSLLGLFFDPEDAGDMFLRNVG
jgi:hypothetical protein